MRIRMVALGLLMVPLLFSTSRVGAQQQGETEHLFAVAVGTHVDGTTSYSHRTYAPQTGLLPPSASEAAPDRSSQLLPVNFQFSPALVVGSSRWSSSATKVWTWAEQAQGVARQIQKNLATIKAAAQQAHLRKGNV